MKILLCNRSLLNRFVAWHQTIQEHVPALTAFKRVMLPLFLKPVKFTFGVATAAINWWKELRRKYCNPSLLQVFPMHRRWVISIALYNVYNEAQQLHSCSTKLESTALLPSVLMVGMREWFSEQITQLTLLKVFHYFYCCLEKGFFF